MDYTEVVKQLYTLLTDKDIESILEHLSEDVKWNATPGGYETILPGLGFYKGKEAVREFFEQLRDYEERVAVTTFEPQLFMTDGNYVFVHTQIMYKRCCDETTTLQRMTGHLWRFNSDGKVNFVQEYSDLARLAAIHL